MFSDLLNGQHSFDMLEKCKVVLVMFDADAPDEGPKAMGIVKDQAYWREAYKELCEVVPPGKRATVLLWELRGDAEKLALSEDIIKGAADEN